MSQQPRRVFFVIAPVKYNKAGEKLHTKGATVPYGVLSIISYINKYSSNKITYQIFDYNIYHGVYDEAKLAMQRKMQDFLPDVVGVAALFNETRFYLQDIINIAKQTNPEVITLIGGAVATNLYSWLFEHVSNLDGIVFAEGEVPMRYLLEANDMRGALGTHSSILTLSDYENGKKPMASYIEDLDILPFIDFSLVDVHQYGGRGKLIDGQKVYLPIHTTRGCPFNCVFCAAKSLHGRLLRKMSGARVLAEVKHMKEQYEFDVLQIDDDQFLLDNARAKFILQGLAAMHVKIAVDSGVSVRYVDEDIAELMKACQLEDVFLAIESGSDRVLKEIIDKPANCEESLRAIEVLKHKGLNVKGFFVLGFPGETEAERQATLQFVLNSKLDWAAFYPAMPFEGTRLYDICIKHGYLSQQQGGFFDFRINTDVFSSNMIADEAYAFNLEANFLKNYNLRISNWEKAICIFLDKTKKYPDHAFAWYSLSKAYEGYGDYENAVKCKNKCLQIIEHDVFWKKWHMHFAGEMAL